ncbi:Zinc finger C3H1 domain-containing protein [Mortierella sp. AM989]|nr:Zinc finger C3H1 domain-containing protein [Mortierella sp. AM989]
MVTATGISFPAQEPMDIVHNQDVDEQEEPEGPRMTRLRGILDKSLKETLKACNYDAISECFPALAAGNPRDLREAHEKVCQFLNVEVNNEFEQIIEERNVIFKLNGLDRLIADARSKGNTAGSRTTLDLSPEVAVRARTVPTKEAEIERLKAELERGASIAARVPVEEMDRLVEATLRHIQDDTMSKSLADLDALRAAVLMSRRQPSQVAANVDQSTVETPVENSSESAIDSSIKFSPEKASMSRQEGSVAISSIETHTPTLHSTNNKLSSPTTGLLSSPKAFSSQLADREDGEISDEELEADVYADKRKGHNIDSVASVNRSDMRSNQPNGVAIEAQGTAVPSLHGRPILIDHYTSLERTPAYTQRVNSTRRPSITAIASTGKSKSSNVDDIQLGRDPDFTTLIKEYQLQKAKTDSKPPFTSTNQDQTIDSEIPGLGHFKSFSFPEPTSSERNFRRHPGTGRRSGDHPRQLIPRGQRVARVTNQVQIYSLVEELLGYGVTPEYLVRMGIDAAAVYHVSRTRTPQASPVAPGGPVQSFHLNPQAVAIAGLKPGMHYTQPSTSVSTTQPFAPQFGHTHQSHSAGYTTQDTLPVSAQQQHTQMLQIQQAINQQQSMLTPAALSSDGNASMALDMILAFAAKILPQGWHSLVPQGGADINATSTNVASQETAQGYTPTSYASPTPYQINEKGKPLEHLREIKLEQDGDRQALLSRNSGVIGEGQASSRSGWNLSEEARYTTAKFQDLSISPSQQMHTQATSTNAINPAQVFTRGMDSSFISKQFKLEELPSTNNEGFPTNLASVSILPKHGYPRDTEEHHDINVPLASRDTSRSPSRPPPPPAHPPPSPPPPPTSTPPSPPPPPPTSTPPLVNYSPRTELSLSTALEKSASVADLKSNRNVLGPAMSSSADSAEPIDLYYLETIRKVQDYGEAVSRRSSIVSQDDADMDIDNDDDSSEPTILKGSWKTTEDMPASSVPSTQPVSRRPTHIRFDRMGNAMPLQVHSAPILMSNTQADNQDSRGQFHTTMSRPQRAGRRVTAKDFMSKTLSSTPFIQERALSYLIDIDDDDDNGEFRGDLPASKSSTPMSRADSVNSPQESRTLQDIQQQLKELNERILAKQRAKRSAPSALAMDASTQRFASAGLLSRSETESPARPSGNSSNSEDQTMEKAPEIPSISQEAIEKAEDLKRTISEHKASLERLRSQKHQCELDRAAAINLLANITPVNGDNKDFDILRKCIDDAAEKVVLKTRELEDAKRYLEETKSRIEPLLSQQSNLQTTKDRLQERINTADGRTMELKGSIGVLQQNIIQMRTQLMILEGESIPKMDFTHLENGYSPSTSTSQTPTSTQDANNDVVGPKRGIDSQALQAFPTNVKKPRTQAREEFSALSKRMQELEREKDLLRMSSAPIPSNDSPPSTKVAEEPSTYATPSIVTNGTSAISTQHPEKAMPALLSPSHPSSHRAPPSHLKSNPGTLVADVGITSTAVSKSLSRLDEFLAQDKSLPVIVTTDSDTQTPALSWRPISGIKKLYLAESCLFELDQLCVPTELIRYVVPDRQSEPQTDFPAAQHKLDVTNPDLSKDLIDYVSPLPMFRSFRFSPRFRDAVRDGYKSLTYSNKIDPMKPMCLYELSGGSCNDDSCKSQHARDYELTDEELVIDMARYAEGNTVESRRVFAEMQSAKLAHLRAAGIHNADLLVDSIVKNHREFVQDTSRTVKFGERIVTDSEPAGNRVTKIKPKSHGGNRTVDRLVQSSKSGSSSLDQIPITMAILSKALSGSPVKNRRYHEQRHPDDFEKLVQLDPSNETLWIEYATSHLSVASVDDADDVENRSIHSALSVIARALGVHPTSESLWGLYLDLYTRHGAELETRQMFEQCLQYVPDAQLIWFRYFLWEKGRDERVYVLDRMLERACQEPREADDEAARSRFTLDVVLQIVKTMVSENCVESAKNWMQNFLTCATWESIVPSSLSYAQLDDVWIEQDMVENIAGTLAAKLLKPNDHCVLWLAFVYLIWFHELPDQLFFDYPNSYISDNSLFVIHWPEIEEPEQESELHSIVHDIFLGLTVYFVDCDARSPLIATVKNFVGFLIARGQQQEEILELVNPSQFPESFPEIRDLFCQVRMHFNRNVEAKRDLQHAIQESPMQPYLWNRYARLQPLESKQACLEQCVYEFFKVESSHEVGIGRSELALLLYKKLLGLDLPYSYEAPPARLDITPFKTNVFLWLNYLSLLALGSEREGSYVQLEAAFSSAMEALPADKISVTRTEFAIHSIMKELYKATSSAAINSIVSAAIGDFNTSISNPYDHSFTEEAKPATHDVTKLLKDVEYGVKAYDENINGNRQALSSQELDSGSDMEMDN